MATIHRAHGLVDGGYLRSLAENEELWFPGEQGVAGRYFVNPKTLLESALDYAQGWGGLGSHTLALTRVTYYDGADLEGGDDEMLEAYWDRVERLPDTEAKFGFLKPGVRKKKRVQKGVDVHLAVDLVVGAHTQLFDVALLFTGDADFVPAVEEARRRGVMVTVAAELRSLSDQLAKAADRVVPLDRLGYSGDSLKRGKLPPLTMPRLRAD